MAGLVEDIVLSWEDPPATPEVVTIPGGYSFTVTMNAGAESTVTMDAGASEE